MSAAERVAAARGKGHVAGEVGHADRRARGAQRGDADAFLDHELALPGLQPASAARISSMAARRQRMRSCHSQSSTSQSARRPSLRGARQSARGARMNAPLHVPTASDRLPLTRADRRAARLLRRGRPGDRDRRARDRALRRAGLCPARDRPQPLRGRRPEGQGRGVRRGTRRGARRRAGGVLARTACPRRSRPRRPARGLDWLDATCPLVSKVHRQAERQIEAGRHIVFIGHAAIPR